MKNKPTYLDTNVFIYWLDVGSPFNSTAAATLRKLEKYKDWGVTSVITLTELRSGLGEDGSSALQEIQALVHTLLVDETIAIRAGELRQLYPALRTPDAIHLATALISGASKMVTADKKLHSIASKQIKCTLLK
ncbi:type II toxin-antitoxin system VapC family toxin [Candidatus Saccharibacteria bacterium]|nr:type II toxin-antitoxin system VapC family toxin [Candidatus Saccharibacteria bacterium]